MRQPWCSVDRIPKFKLLLHDTGFTLELICAIEIVAAPFGEDGYLCFSPLKSIFLGYQLEENARVYEETGISNNILSQTCSYDLEVFVPSISFWDCIRSVCLWETYWFCVPEKYTIGKCFSASVVFASFQENRLFFPHQYRLCCFVRSLM